MRFALLSLLSLSAVASAEQPPLCSEGEITVLSCAIEAKGVSLCLGMDAETPKSLRYLFGAHDKVEIELPLSAAGDPVPSGYLSFASGGTAFAVFANGSYEYVVYSSNGGGRGACKDDPDAWCPWLHEGVLVLKGGAVVSNLPCRGNDGPSELWRRMASFAPATTSDDEVNARISDVLSVDLSREVP